MREFDLPLAVFELRRHARARRLHAARLVAPGIAAVIVFFNWLFEGRSDPLGAAGMSGRAIVSVVTYLGFVICIFYPVALSSGAIAAERNAGTMPLLLLARGKVTEIYFSKMLGILLPTLSLIASLAPLLGIASFLGGVSLKTILVMTGGAVSFTVYAAATGLLISSCAKRLITAFAGTLAWLLVAMPLLTSAISPYVYWPPLRSLLFPNDVLRIMISASAGNDRMVTAMLGCLLHAAAFAFVTLFILRRTAQSVDYSPLRKWGRLRLRSKRWIRLGPVGELYDAVSESIAGRMLRFPWNVVIALTFLVIATYGEEWAQLLLLLLVFDIVSSLGRARESGVLESMFVLPETSKILTRQIYLCYLRRALVFLPAMIFLSWPGVLREMQMQALVESKAQWMFPGMSWLAVFWDALLGFFGGLATLTFACTVSTAVAIRPVSLVRKLGALLLAAWFYQAVCEGAIFVIPMASKFVLPDSNLAASLNAGAISNWPFAVLNSVVYAIFAALFAYHYFQQYEKKFDDLAKSGLGPIGIA
jgi:hypothetical protein